MKQMEEWFSVCAKLNKTAEQNKNYFHWQQSIKMKFKSFCQTRKSPVRQLNDQTMTWQGCKKGKHEMGQEDQASIDRTSALLCESLA